MSNAIAIARHLAEAGLAKPVAEAVAEAVVTHADESMATKADMARLEGKIDSSVTLLSAQINGLAMQVKILLGLMTGLYVGLAMLIINHLGG